LWKPIERAYHWLHAAAHVLSNGEERSADELQRAFGRVLSNIGLVKRHLGPLEEAMNHFLKVTRSYRPGLFHCYRIDDLPRTNNDLEQLFGQHRHHERRATGRKRAPLSTVLRGSVQLVAGVATRRRCRKVWTVWRERSSSRASRAVASPLAMPRSKSTRSQAAGESLQRPCR
jgi:hypothetical protein